jgi:hypothetical protein
MRLTTQFLNQRLILLYADIYRAMRVLCAGVLLAASAGSGRSVAQGLSAEEKETETIRGTVVNSVTQEPVGRALVYSLDNRFAMLCDAGGHFEFKIPRAKSEAVNGNGPSLVFYNAAGGEYGRMGGPAALLARKPGFLSDEKAQRVTLANDAEQGLTIQLVPEALIIGRVKLPTTDGTDRLVVELYKRTVQEGRAQWEQAGSTQTRANGTFRFADLAGGSYKIFTREEIDRDPLTFDPRGQLYGYPPVYYPSFNDFESSSAIRLTAGATVSVNLTPVRREYYPIKIGISNAPQGAGFQIEAWPQGHPGPGYSLGYEQDEQSIVGMLPDGNYTVEANANGPTISSGQMNISVRGGGLEGATLSLVPNGSIQVNVKQEMTAPEMGSQGNTYEVNGKPASKSQYILSSVHVNLLPLDEFQRGGMGRFGQTGAADGETRVLEHVSPGRYGVHVTAQLGYVAAVSSGGLDLLHNPLVVAPGGTSSPIEITLRDDGATVEGTIENWRSETQGRDTLLPGQQLACIYLVPMTETMAPPLVGWTGDGHFSLQQVPPGSYRALAFNRQPGELEFTNEEAMKKYEAKSQVIQLEAGQKHELRLQLNAVSE